MPSIKTTKFDLVEAVYRSDKIAKINQANKLNKIDKQDVQKVIDELLEQVKLSLSQGNNIELRGFGTFELRFRKGRGNARNPKTGEKLSSAPHYVVAFRAGKELSDSVRNLPAKDNKSSPSD